MKTCTFQPSHEVYVSVLGTPCPFLWCKVGVYLVAPPTDPNDVRPSPTGGFSLVEIGYFLKVADTLPINPINLLQSS